jgi:cyclopropane-fatty-acyl-phospholipid synthase
MMNEFLKKLESLQFGTIFLTTPDGKKYTFQGDDPEPTATLIIKDWRVVINLVAKGDVGFAESYRDGYFECDNLANLLILALKNENILDEYVYGGFFSTIAARISYYLRSNTLKGSRRNIHAHYDLGNNFYSLWLDPTMTYSSAIFDDDNQTLEQAQQNKYDSIIKKLEKSSGNLLEIGCGWGGFAERALFKGDYCIKGITLSCQQQAFANNRLKNKAEIALEDYRSQAGQYDSIVSIEMFEAVGEKYWPIYFKKIKSLLSKNGKAVIQTITIDDAHFQRYRKTSDMLRSFIFPGGMLPSISRFKEEAAKAGLQVTDNFGFGDSYVKTLKHWLGSFEENLSKIRTINFDEKFIRIWRFYLCACIATFSVGRTNVIQAEVAHG